MTYAHRVSLLFCISLLLLSAGCNNRSRGRVDPGDGGAGDTGMPPVDAATDSTPPGDTGTTSDTGTTADTGTTDTGMTTGAGDEAVAGYLMITEAECEAGHRCRAEITVYYPDATDADFVMLFGANVTECVALRYPIDGQNALRDAVNSGTVIYDGTSASACVTMAAGASCELFWTDSTIPACDATATGTLPLGSTCRISLECTSRNCSGGSCAVRE